MDIRSVIDQEKSKISSLNITTPDAVRAFQKEYLGTEGLLKKLSGEIKNIPAELRKESGQMINEFKQFVEQTYEPLKRIIVPEVSTFPSRKIEDAIKQANPELHKKITKTETPVVQKPVVIPVPAEPTHKREPLYGPGEKFWTMLNDKAVEGWIGAVETQHTAREFSISYSCYFSRAAVGIVVSGIPDTAPFTRKENRMFKTKELLLASL